jgi:hypothetical protein
MNVLSDYFNGDTLKAAELNEFIRDNREEVIQESIVRKITKEKL